MGTTIYRNVSQDQAKELLKDLLSGGISSPEVKEFADRVAYHPDATNLIMPFNRVKELYVYVDDPDGKELFIAPHRQIKIQRETGKFTGDCDDAALLIASIFGALGRRVKLSIVDSNGDGMYDHVIACTFHKGSWVDMDLTDDKPLGWIYDYRMRDDIFPEGVK